MTVLAILLGHGLLFAGSTPEISEYDGKKVRVPAARLEITTYGWTYFVDKAAIEAVTESALKNMDMSEAEAANTRNTSFVAFFLFEPEDRIMNAFRTNINLVIESGLKKDLASGEYAEMQAKNIGHLLKDATVIEVAKVTNPDAEIYKIEFVFNSPRQDAKSKPLRCHAISYSAIVGGKGYVFTAVATEKDFRVKKPAMLRTLGSLKKYNP